MTTRILCFIVCVCTVMSCSFFEGLIGGKDDEAPLFGEADFYGEERVILGETLEIRTSLDLVSPEIYVGTRKMDFTVKENAGDNVKIISILFPEEITVEMYSNEGIAGNLCRIMLRSGIEGEETVSENIIAYVRIYEKTTEFHGDDASCGDIEFADIENGYLIYSDDNQGREERNWNNHDYTYGVPMKVTGNTAGRLAFKDSEDNEIFPVYMRQVQTLSEDYIYAEIEFVTSVDTVYNDYESSVGSVYEDWYFDTMDVLIRMSDGKLIQMQDPHSESEIMHFRHLCQWLSPDTLLFSEDPHNLGDQMPDAIISYRIGEDNAEKTDRYGILGSYPDGTYPEKTYSFDWTANASDGIVIKEYGFYSFGDRRLERTYWEALSNDGSPYVTKILEGDYRSTPVVGGNGSIYALIGSHYTSPCLCILDSEGVFRRTGKSADIGLPYTEVSHARSGDNVYMFWNGGCLKIDGEGNITEYDDVLLSQSGYASVSSYYPYTTDYVYFVPGDGSFYRKLLSDPDAQAEALENVDTSYMLDYMGQLCVATKSIPEGGADCKIILDNEVVYSLVLEGLDYSGRYPNFALIRQ